MGLKLHSVRTAGLPKEIGYIDQGLCCIIIVITSVPVPPSSLWWFFVLENFKQRTTG